MLPFCSSCVHAVALLSPGSRSLSATKDIKQSVQLAWLELMCMTGKGASPELQNPSAAHTLQAVCGAGVYRPAVMSSFRLATARRDFLRAAVFSLMMPLTTALSIS